ncbi:MAG: hypothetical protein R3A13_02490 [Bdellovibrionota bacterium]
MIKQILVLLLLLSSFTVVVAQENNESSESEVEFEDDSQANQPQDTMLEGLSDEDLKRIDAFPYTEIPAEEVILPNGRNLKEYAEERGITAEFSHEELIEAKREAQQKAVFDH